MGRQNADKIAANMTFKKLCRKRRELLAHFAHHDKKAPPEGAAAALLVLRAVVYANLSENGGRLAEKTVFQAAFRCVHLQPQIEAASLCGGRLAPWLVSCFGNAAFCFCRYSSIQIPIVPSLREYRGCARQR